LAAALSQGSLGRAIAPFEAPLDGTGAAPDEGDFAKLRAAAHELFVRPTSSAIVGPLRRARMERDRGRFLAAVSLAVHYYRDVLRWKILGDGVAPANGDRAREIAADAAALPLPALSRRIRLLEEIAAAVQSNVTAAYAVASAQHRMGLGAS
jgi:hypothetical protein